MITFESGFLRNHVWLYIQRLVKVNNWAKYSTVYSYLHYCNFSTTTYKSLLTISITYDSSMSKTWWTHVTNTKDCAIIWKTLKYEKPETIWYLHRTIKKMLGHGALTSYWLWIPGPRDNSLMLVENSPMISWLERSSQGQQQVCMYSHTNMQSKDDDR